MEFCMGQKQKSLGGGGAPVNAGRDATGVIRSSTKRLAFTSNGGVDPHVANAGRGPANPPNFTGFARYHRVKFTANHGQDEHFVNGGRRAPTGKVADSAVKRDFIAHSPKSQVGGCAGFGRSKSMANLASYNKALRDVRASVPRAAATSPINSNATILNAEISSQVLCHKAMECNQSLPSCATQSVRDDASCITTSTRRTTSSSRITNGTKTTVYRSNPAKSIAPSVRDFGCVSVAAAPLRSKVRRNAPTIDPKQILTKSQQSVRDDASSICSVRTAGVRTFGNPMGTPLGSQHTSRNHLASQYNRATVHTQRSQPWDITNKVTRVAPLFRHDQAAALRGA